MSRAKMHVKKGDTVMVVSGRSDSVDPKTNEPRAGIKGKTGTVLLVDPVKHTVVVEGVNIIKRAVRPTQQNTRGGFSEKEAPLHASKVRPVCPACGKPTRVRHQVENEAKSRVCAKCGGKL